jgi:seryl-tRNA synthetase
MLSVNYLRENLEKAVELLKVRNIKDLSSKLNSIIATDDERKNIQNELDTILSKSNTLAKEIGNLFKTGKRDEAEILKQETTDLKEKSNVLKEKQAENKALLEDKLLEIPNIPHPTVPAGNSDEENQVEKTVGEIPTLYDGAQPHWELGKTYNLFDFELGVKIAGAGFPVYKGQGARLQRSLINFFLNSAVDAGYEELILPMLVNEDSARGTGQLPDKEGQMYEVPIDGLFLIPTAEVPITNIYRDVMMKEAEFPVKMTGHSFCFRREAGSYGKDVKGLNRLHQFEKIEIVRIEHPEKSYEALDEMVAYVESLVKKLGLPYRLLRLCGGDLTFTSALTFDIEVYSAAQKMWLEVSSISNFETYQANRLNLRYKNKDGKKALAHTLNGSAIALPRIMAALLENNQEDGYIKVPEVLQAFMGTDKILKAEL